MGLRHRLFAAVAVLAAGLPVAAGADTILRDGRSVTLPPPHPLVSPPATTIYWSVGKDGGVTLSDRPAQGAGRQDLKSYGGPSYPESLARAERERDHWRRQSDAFDARQRQRDHELEQARMARLQTYERERQADGPWMPYVGVVRGGGHDPWQRRIPTIAAPAPSFQQPQAFAPGQGPAPFLGSGFATGLRR